MSRAPEDVEKHYGRGRILDSILASLREAGKDPTRLEPEDLAPVDEFHIRGREATVELAGRASLQPGSRVLDVGCGLGGSARYLAAEHRCQVTGIDLTEEYVDVATTLAGMVGLGDRIEFEQANALDMPFDDAAFDVVWTQHVQMNIADKTAFYREIARVTRPRGLFLFHDIFGGDGGPLHYPVPWAEDSSISFLAAPALVKRTLEDLGFVLRLGGHDRALLALDRRRRREDQGVGSGSRRNTSLDGGDGEDEARERHPQPARRADRRLPGLRGKTREKLVTTPRREFSGFFASARRTGAARPPRNGGIVR